MTTDPVTPQGTAEPGTAAPGQIADLRDWLEGDDHGRWDIFELWTQGKRDTDWLIGQIADDLADIFSARAAAQPAGDAGPECVSVTPDHG